MRSVRQQVVRAVWRTTFERAIAAIGLSQWQSLQLLVVHFQISHVRDAVLFHLREKNHERDAVEENDP